MTKELSKHLEEFILTRCYFDLEKILMESNPDSDYGLIIRVLEMFDWNPDLAEECLMRPAKFSKAFEEAIQSAQPRFMLIHEYPDRLRIKSRVFARFSGLPLTPWTFFERIPTASSLGKLVSVRGTVIRTGGLKMQECSKEWECTRCKTRQVTLVDDHQYGHIPKPVVCTGLVDDVPCKNGKFHEVPTATAQHVDYQDIKIQELTSVLEIGAVPRSILVILRNELVDQCRAGDDVIITGILGCRSKPNLKADCSHLDGELFLQATSIQSTASITESSTMSTLGASDESQLHEKYEKYWREFAGGAEEIRGRSRIVNSFCPQMHGMFLLKLATLMTIIGGCSRNEGERNADEEEDNGARRSRKEGHLLLVGDPGTGKSQFLVNAARLINRSVMTTGSGSTTAGLTCAAVKDGHDWQLEAGALVMADRGICCIDEFNALRPQDRTAIHEAMEQQTLSVAKAGLVCKLNTRCSIIAACNVKGEMEEGKPISANLALASPLLSRFDLIFLLLDRKRGDSWDSDLCDRLLFGSGSDGNNMRSDVQNQWEFEELKEYVNFVRNRMDPKMSAIGELVLSRYYQLQRRSDTLRCARTTVRLLESLVRLAQAHAKLMFHREVELVDAITAVLLVEASLTSTQTLESSVNLHASEMEMAEYAVWYEALEKELLCKLEINKANHLDSESESESENLSESNTSMNLSEGLLDLESPANTSFMRNSFTQV